MDMDVDMLRFRNWFLDYKSLRIPVRKSPVFSPILPNWIILCIQCATSCT